MDAAGTRRGRLGRVVPDTGRHRGRCRAARVSRGPGVHLIRRDTSRRSYRVEGHSSTRTFPVTPQSGGRIALRHGVEWRARRWFRRPSVAPSRRLESAAFATPPTAMPVNLKAPDPAALHAVPGLRIGIAMAGIRKANRRDLVVFGLDDGAAVAGVFTRNRFCAAPVQLCREHLAAGARHPRAAGQHRQCQRRHRRRRPGARAPQLRRAGRGCSASRREQVLPFSTGVIMETLPVERIEAGAAGRRWADAAAPTAGPKRRRAIMTTDTVPKAASRQVQRRRPHRHRHRHLQGRRHDPARTWRRCSASSPPTR